MADEQQNSGGDSQKILNAYKKNVQILTALLGSDEPLKGKRKVKKDDMRDIIQELFGEEVAATKAEVKDEIKNLIKTYVAFVKAVKEKEKELEALKISKMKEFNTASNALVQKIEGVGTLVSEYEATLTQVIATTTTTITTETEIVEE